MRLEKREIILIKQGDDDDDHCGHFHSRTEQREHRAACSKLMRLS